MAASLARVTGLGHYFRAWLRSRGAILAALPELTAQETFSDIDEQMEQAATVNAAAQEAERQADDAKRLEQEASDAEAESRQANRVNGCAQAGRCQSG